MRRPCAARRRSLAGAGSVSCAKAALLLLTVLAAAVAWAPTMPLATSRRVLPQGRKAPASRCIRSSPPPSTPAVPNRPRSRQLLMSPPSDGKSSNDMEEVPSAPTAIDAAGGGAVVAGEVPAGEPQGRLAKFKAEAKKFFKGDSAFRKKLEKAGLAAALSYGWVSNASYAICISVAWYLATVRSGGVSPLAPGQWQYFLGVYAGVFALNNIIRPFRFALSITLAPFFENFIKSLQSRTGWSRTVCTGCTVVIFNVFGTIFLMGGGVCLASYLGGAPVWVRSVAK